MTSLRSWAVLRNRQWPMLGILSTPVGDAVRPVGGLSGVSGTVGVGNGSGAGGGGGVGGVGGVLVGDAGVVFGIPRPLPFGAVVGRRARLICLGLGCCIHVRCLLLVFSLSPRSEPPLSQQIAAVTLAGLTRPLLLRPAPRLAQWPALRAHHAPELIDH